MRILDPGHRYEVDLFDRGKRLSAKVMQIVFQKDRVEARPDRKDTHDGTNCQELIRVLIDRVQTLNEEVPHEVNPKIIQNLRECLVMFEIRALGRKIEKRVLYPEKIPTGSDGHFDLGQDKSPGIVTEDEKDVL